MPKRHMVFADNTALQARTAAQQNTPEPAAASPPQRPRQRPANGIRYTTPAASAATVIHQRRAMPRQSRRRLVSARIASAENGHVLDTATYGESPEEVGEVVQPHVVHA